MNSSKAQKLKDVNNFNVKLANYLKKEYRLAMSEEPSPNAENNLYKTKHDIIKKIRDSLISYVILSDMFRAGFLPNGKKKKSDICKDNGIYQGVYRQEILNMIDYHIHDSKKSKNSGEPVKDEFIENHRKISMKIFDDDIMKLVLDSVFLYNEPLVRTQKEMNTHARNQIKESEVRYYTDISKLLVKTGVEQIIKHLNSAKEKNLISQLNYFTEMIGRLSVPDLSIINKDNEPQTDE